MLQRIFPGTYEGWFVVGASAFFGAIAAGSVHYGFGTVFEPLREEFGWGVGATAIAFSLRTEVNGIAAPIIGMMFDRIGAQRTIIFGVILVSASVFAMSFIQNLWQFYLAMFFISVGLSSSSGPVSVAATATWFRRRRARAISVVTLGGGLAAVLVIPMATLVDEVGWRDALRVVSAVLLLGGLVPILLVRERPAGHPQPMDGTAPERDEHGSVVPEPEQWGIPPGPAIRSRSFQILTLALAGGGFTTTAFVVLQIPFLETEVGLSKEAAAATVGVFGIASIPGRLGFAWLADRYPKRIVLAMTLALVLVGMLLLPFVNDVWQAIPVVSLIAVGFGGAVPVRPALVADYFGTRHFGTIFGLTTFVRTLGATLGPLVVGFTYDRTDTYTPGWVFSAALVALIIPLLLIARPPNDLAETFRKEARERGTTAAS